MYGFNEYISKPALSVGSSFSTVIKPADAKLQSNQSSNRVITHRVTGNNGSVAISSSIYARERSNQHHLVHCILKKQRCYEQK
jgi:hypothetical protein